MNKRKHKQTIQTTLDDYLTTHRTDNTTSSHQQHNTFPQNNNQFTKPTEDILLESVLGAEYSVHDMAFVMVKIVPNGLTKLFNIIKDVAQMLYLKIGPNVISGDAFGFANVCVVMLWIESINLDLYHFVHNNPLLFAINLREMTMMFKACSTSSNLPTKNNIGMAWYVKRSSLNVLSITMAGKSRTTQHFTSLSIPKQEYDMKVCLCVGVQVS